MSDEYKTLVENFNSSW